MSSESLCCGRKGFSEEEREIAVTSNSVQDQAVRHLCCLELNAVSESASETNSFPTGVCSAYYLLRLHGCEPIRGSSLPLSCTETECRDCRRRVETLISVRHPSCALPLRALQVARRKASNDNNAK